MDITQITLKIVRYTQIFIWKVSTNPLQKESSFIIRSNYMTTLASTNLSMNKRHSDAKSIFPQIQYHPNASINVYS